MFNKGLISEVYKELKQLNTHPPKKKIKTRKERKEKISNPIWKIAKGPEETFSKKTWMASNIWKGAQNH